MKMILFALLAFIGGVFLAIQAAFNTQLGSELQHPVLAVASTSFFSTIFALGFYLLSKQQLPTLQVLQQPPYYLWYIGAVFSFIGISLYFYTIPKLGIATMITFGLCGQLVFSLIAGNYGWMNLPIEPFTTKRLIGTIAMIVGIILINFK